MGVLPLDVRTNKVERNENKERITREEISVGSSPVVEFRIHCETGGDVSVLGRLIIWYFSIRAITTTTQPLQSRLALRDATIHRLLHGFCLTEMLDFVFFHSNQRVSFFSDCGSRQGEPGRSGGEHAKRVTSEPVG
eukprot:scaffold3523_cov110-Cylindrotheca_fusiformis.AAC.2